MLRKVISKITGDTYSDKYIVGKKIFSAAFSDIYEARSRASGEHLIIKILNESGERIARRLDEDDDAMWEGELLMTFDHPNIVRGYDYYAGKKYWIAMENLESTLNSYLTRNPQERDEAELLAIFRGVASAISYLHERGLVHRDIAPDNVMLSGDGEAKLIDFGMTTPIGSNAVKGRVGTPSYMAPEMIRQTESTPGADIYSLGIVMYELVTGVKLFGGRLKEERMTRVLNVHPLTPSELEKSCSMELEELIMCCVAKKPEWRPKDARTVVNKLDDMLSKMSVNNSGAM